jgi:hypothetical protein
VPAVVGAGADQQLAVVGHLGVRGPDLGAGDDVVVAVPHGPGPHGGQVAAGVGLGEPLAPDLVAFGGWPGGTAPAAQGVPSAMMVGPAWSRPTKLTPT